MSDWYDCLNIKFPFTGSELNWVREHQPQYLHHLDSNQLPGVSANSINEFPPRASLAERNTYFDFRACLPDAVAACGLYLEGAARIGRSLAHAEQTQAAVSVSSGRVMIRIEADSVVIDRQLNEGRPSGELYRHVAGVGVALDVFQSFLKNAVERQFGVGGQSRGQLHAGQLDGHARPLRELRAGIAQDGDQTQFVQDTGAQIA